MAYIVVITYDGGDTVGNLGAGAPGKNKKIQVIFNQMLNL
jgi:hypothetical protein